MESTAERGGARGTTHRRFSAGRGSGRANQRRRMVARGGLLPGGLAERLVELTAEASWCAAGSAKVMKANEVGDVTVGPATCTPLVGAGSIHLQQALSGAACWPWHRG